MDIVNFQRKQLSHWILNLIGDVELDIGTQLVSPCLIHMLNTVSLLAFTPLHLDLRNAIADLRLIAGVTLGHTIGQYAMSNLIRILVIVTQRLTHDVLLQWNLVTQNLLESFGHKRLSLPNVSIVQQDIQSTSEYFLDNRSVITTLQNNTHGLPLGLDVGVIFLHHADLPLATEQNEWIERLFLANDLRLAALLRNAIRSLHTQLNTFRNVLRRESNEDRIGISLDNIRPKLGLHDILGKQQLLTTRSRGGSRHTETTNRRRTASCLTLHRVRNDLVGQLKTIENRLLTFVGQGLRKFASFLTLFEKNV